MATGLEGVKDLTGQLTELGAKLAARELRGTVKNALGEAEHRARARIPQGEEIHVTYRGRIVSGGFALSTLHIETFVNKREGSAVAMLGVEREAFYAVSFLEVGTARMAARPWLVPSFLDSQEPMLHAIGVELRTRIAKIAKSRARKAAKMAGPGGL